MESLHSVIHLLDRPYTTGESFQGKKDRFSTFEEEVRGRLEDLRKLSVLRQREEEKATRLELLETYKEEIDFFRNHIRWCLNMPRCERASMKAPAKLLAVFPEYVEWKDGKLTWTRPSE